MSFWSVIGVELAKNFIGADKQQRAPLQQPRPVSLGEYRRGTGTRARTTASRAAPVTTAASYDPQSRYKAILQKMYRESVVKQAKAPKA